MEGVNYIPCFQECGVKASLLQYPLISHFCVFCKHFEAIINKKVVTHLNRSKLLTTSIDFTLLCSLLMS